MNIDLDRLVDLLHQLYGLPADLLVGLLCIVVGYVLRLIKSFPNNAIPLCCVILGAVFLPIIEEPCPAGTTLIAWRVRNVIIGMIIGCAAWLFHRLVLKRVEDKFPWLKNLLEPDAPQDTEVPPPKTPYFPPKTP